MAKKIITIILTVMVVACIPTQPKSATINTKYMLTERFNTSFYDINKTNKGDNKMCWAASISNMAGFATGEDPSFIFTFFKKKYGNTSNSIYLALISLFKSFGYTTEDLLLITTFDYRKINKRIDLCIIGILYQGRVVNIGIDKTLTSKLGHALTVYGFELINEETYIFYVDSNDGIHKLYREKIKCKKGITRITTGYYKGHVIDSVVGLQVFKRE